MLNQKTELQRALEKQKERHVITAQNEMNKDCTSSLHGELGKVGKRYIDTLSVYLILSINLTGHNGKSSKENF